MKERCRDGCRTSLLIAGVVLVLAIFHTSLPLCHPYITIHFMEMIFSTCIILNKSSLFVMKSFRGSLSVCSYCELNFTAILDLSLSLRVQQARSIRESLCFLISTAVVAPQVCCQLSSLVHHYFNTTIADNPVEIV